MKNHQNKLEQKLIYAMTLFTFALAGACFYYAVILSSAPFFLLACVTFGTGFDFLSHILGIIYAQKKRFLLWYAKINFSLLCFGIVFTPLSATFVIAKVAPSGLNSRLISQYPAMLLFSLLFGALFMIAKYAARPEQGALEYTLDKKDPYTYRIFLARRILLGMSLIIALIAVFEGVQTKMALWSILFAASFIATIPLHIRHKMLASIAAETLSLGLLFCGSWRVFVE